jgi:cobalt/nickel transport system permease protein
MNAPLVFPQLMHAPDGFFSAWLSLLGWGITVAIISLAIRNTKEQLGERQVPLMGVLAAAIFAGQMLNFTIPGGTSGHLLGGALAAIILGPWAGVLVITSVVAIQALLFQDGGLLAMGLNIINMGIIPSFAGYFVHRGLTHFWSDDRGRFAGAFVAGWVSVVLAAVFVAVELALSGSSALAITLPAMVGVHMMIGIGEGLLTAFTLNFLTETRADLLRGQQAPGQRSAGIILVGLLFALGLTLFAPFASPYADGLERVAEALSAPDQNTIPPMGFQIPETRQFFGEAREPLFKIFPNYAIPGLASSRLGVIAAGMIGVLVVFLVAYGLARLIRRVPDKHDPLSPG